MRSRTFVQRLFGFSDVWVRAFFIALDSIHKIAFLVFWFVVFWVDRFLSYYVDRFEEHGDEVLVENPPKFFRNPRYIGDDNVVLALFPFNTHSPSGFCGCFHKGPDGVPTSLNDSFRCLFSFSWALALIGILLAWC